MLYSTRFHWNFVVNGRDSFAPLAHQELAGRATIPQVFTEENIEWLKRRHAVEYLVINWPLLNPGEILQARTRLPFLASQGDEVSASPQATVFRLREKKEITVLERTYSAYHLRHRQVLVRLRKPYTLSARVAVAGRPWKEFRLNGSRETPLPRRPRADRQGLRSAAHQFFRSRSGSRRSAQPVSAAPPRVILAPVERSRSAAANPARRASSMLM